MKRADLDFVSTCREQARDPRGPLEVGMLQDDRGFHWLRVESRSVEGLIFEQEVLVEGAELALRMDDGDLEDP